MNLIVETNHPVAYESPDHKMPWGTKRDNHTHQGLIDELLEEYGSPNVMDLGCSGGQFIVDLANLGCIAVGLEGSDYSIKHQRANWPEYHNRHLFTADVTKPYKVYNNSEQVYFDIITAWELVEHIAPDDIENLLTHITDNLKSGGKFIASISTKPDVINGFVLHQSVFTQDHWLNELLPPICKKLGLTIHEYPYEFAVRWDWGSFHIMLIKE